MGRAASTWITALAATAARTPTPAEARLRPWAGPPWARTHTRPPSTKPYSSDPARGLGAGLTVQASSAEPA